MLWAGAQSLGGTSPFLADVLQPYGRAAEGATRSYHEGGDASWDLLRTEYAVGPWRIDLTESASHVTVRFRGLAPLLSPMSDLERKAFLGDLARAALAPEWHAEPWRLVGETGTRILYSSSPPPGPDGSFTSSGLL